MASKNTSSAFAEEGATQYIIVAFGRGHVIICNSQFLTDAEAKGDSYLRAPRAATIRNWGTEHGLGELGAKGPTAGTTLDCIAYPLRIPRDAIHLVLDCSPDSCAKFKPALVEAEKRMLVSK